MKKDKGKTNPSKLLIAMMSMILIVSTLLACSTSKHSTQDIMIVRPSEFSDETKQVLELFD